MDYLQKYRSQLSLRLYSSLIGVSVATSVLGYIATTFLQVPWEFGLLLAATIGLLLAITLSAILTRAIARPIELIEQAVSFAADSTINPVAPNVDNATLGRELLQNMIRHIYNFASHVSQTNSNTEASQHSPQKILDSLPLPIIGLDMHQNITVISKSACELLRKSSDQLLGKPLDASFPLTYPTESTIQSWINTNENSAVVANTHWRRVSHSLGSDQVLLLDIHANYSKNHDSGIETFLILQDKTDDYSQDSQEINFVALAVHELRTPLTVVRGYIEVFEDEIGPKLTPELTDFMHKMKASAEQLTAFVGNILNVARIEQNQLNLTLRSEKWPEILTTAVNDLELRARVHGKHIELHIADNLPLVGVDRISIHEVLNNLVDNAIKYSKDSPKIIISSNVNEQGLIETTVQDFGIGIPQSVIGGLFQQYHRSYKSKGEVGGTGLGLYLCKALIAAHGGNIWVRSKEGKGSTFTFTLLPYDTVSSGQAEREDGIVRGAHGWIKNHSMYRN